MARKRSEITRREVTDTVDKQEQEMAEKTEELEETADDVETIADTLDNLEGGGTNEGVDEVEQSIQEAQEATEDVFEGQDEQLEEIQGEAEEFEQELQERSDSNETDLGRISDASARVETKEGVNELVKAKEATLRDIDFLDEHNDQIRDDLDKSKSEQEEHRARVAAKRK